MADAEKLVDELKLLEDDYKPRGQAAETISQVTLVELIGGFCAGKTTVISRVTELDPGFSNPCGFTTREKRPGDPKEYRMIPHDSANLSVILEKVHAGELVQFAVHPTTVNVYGTEPQDYKTPYAILDTLYSVVHSLGRLGFNKTVPIALVTAPDAYLAQIKQRYPDTMSPVFKKRVQEAILSQSWCLEHADEILWSENYHGQPSKTAADVISIAKSDNPKTEKLDHMAIAMLKSLVNLS